MDARETNKGAVSSGHVICMLSDTWEHLLCSKDPHANTQNLTGLLFVFFSQNWILQETSSPLVWSIGTTVKGQINRWESRKQKLQGVLSPANNLAIHSSL